MKKKIELAKYGRTLGPRVLGRELAIDIANYLSSNNYNKVLISFDGVESISSGFSFELFGLLFDKFQTDFSKRITLDFGMADNKGTLSTIIKESIWQYKEIRGKKRRKLDLVRNLALHFGAIQVKYFNIIIIINTAI